MSKDALCTLLVYGGHTSSEIRDWLALAYNGTGSRDAAYGLGEARKALAKVNAAFAAYDRGIADETAEADDPQCACGSSDGDAHAISCPHALDAADTREATDDQRLHARLERAGPKPAPGGAL